MCSMLGLYHLLRVSDAGLLVHRTLAMHELVCNEHITLLDRQLAYFWNACSRSSQIFNITDKHPVPHFFVKRK